MTDITTFKLKVYILAILHKSRDADFVLYRPIWSVFIVRYVNQNRNVSVSFRLKHRPYWICFGHTKIHTGFRPVIRYRTGKKNQAFSIKFKKNEDCFAIFSP